MNSFKNDSNISQNSKNNTLQEQSQKYLELEEEIINLNNTIEALKKENNGLKDLMRKVDKIKLKKSSKNQLDHLRFDNNVICNHINIQSLSLINKGKIRKKTDFEDFDSLKDLAEVGTTTEIKEKIEKKYREKIEKLIEENKNLSENNKQLKIKVDELDNIAMKLSEKLNQQLDDTN